jgi:hypothetical protein
MDTQLTLPRTLSDALKNLFGRAFAWYLLPTDLPLTGHRPGFP